MYGRPCFMRAHISDSFTLPCRNAISRTSGNLQRHTRLQLSLPHCCRPSTDCFITTEQSTRRAILAGRCDIFDCECALPSLSFGESSALEKYSVIGINISDSVGLPVLMGRGINAIEPQPSGFSSFCFPDVALLSSHLVGPPIAV